MIDAIKQTEQNKYDAKVKLNWDLYCLPFNLAAAVYCGEYKDYES